MRRRRPRRPLATLAAASALLAPALLSPAGVGAQPADLEPIGIRVAGGADAWHPDPDFRVTWSRAHDGATPPPAPSAVDYLVRDAAGDLVVPRTTIPWSSERIEHLRVPAVPGRYTAEVWLEGTPPAEGPHVSVPLLFDNQQPGTAEVAVPERWFGRGVEPRLLIEGASGPTPLSGIRGYAVAIGGDGHPPCAAGERCSETEIDLDAADAPGALPLGPLREGVSPVQVATVSGSGLRSAAVTAAEIRVDLTDPIVELSGAPRGWADGPVRVVASDRDQLSGMAPSGPSGPFTAIYVDGGAPVAAAGSSATTTVGGDGAHLVVAYARDAAGNVSDGSGASGAAATAVVRIDETAPQVTFARTQDPAEPERIEARVSDRLAGPDPARGAIAVRPAGSTAAFQTLPTVASEGHLTAVWDSDSFPPGSYEFRATGYDLAGNSASGDRRDDGARMVLSNPLKQPTQLRFGFGGRRLLWQRCARVGEGRRCRPRVIEDFGRRPAARAAGYGHGTIVSGLLTAASGAPLAGLPVDVVETFDPGSDLTARTTTVRTGPDGRFATRLAPGPSRRIAASFAGGRTLSRAGGRQLRLGVLAAVLLRASSAWATIGGRPIAFSGRLAYGDATMPATGRPVQLQFRVPGMPWSEFRTVQTDAHGRFRYAYAFADDDSRGVRFQFRALAPGAEGWPYEPAASRPVFVTGR